MEFALTMRALKRHLSPGSAILDVGGGPGRYAISLAEQGHRVSLLDLAPANLAFAREKAAQRGVTLDGFHHGNALDLSAWEAERFDAVLLMGPLYHLLDSADRERAVREALRVLKPGGLLAATVILRYAPLRDLAAYEPEQLLPFREVMANQLKTGVLHPQSEGDFAWVDLNEEAATDPSTWGQSGHLLFIGHKSDKNGSGHWPDPSVCCSLLGVTTAPGTVRPFLHARCRRRRAKMDGGVLITLFWWLKRPFLPPSVHFCMPPAYVDVQKWTEPLGRNPWRVALPSLVCVAPRPAGRQGTGRPGPTGRARFARYR